MIENGIAIAGSARFDVAEVFGERIDDPTQVLNFRTPRLDLDCVYGSGPGASNFLYCDGHVRRHHPRARHRQDPGHYRCRH